MVNAIRKGARIDIASIRREQIVEAAVGIIAERGLQHLSLSEIESRVGMSRGQLTYYFPTKEAILLAVFDRLVELIHQRQGRSGEAPSSWQPQSWEEVVQWVLGKILEQPPAHPEFGALQYTFLSQIGHREDFRLRLACLYEGWRSHMAQLLSERYARSAKDKGFPARTLASLIQAILHGVAMQVAADPNVVRREEMVELCLDMLGSYLEKLRRARPQNGAAKISRSRRTNKSKKPSPQISRNGVHA